MKVEGTKDHWLNCGKLCPKGERVVEYVYSPNRLKYHTTLSVAGWLEELFASADIS